MRYLNENEDLEEIIKEGKYLVDFYAEWCGPCKMLGPVLENISDKINIIKVDIDKFENLAVEKGIMSVPTLIFYDDGEEVNKVIGFRTEEDLLEIINEL